MTHLYHYCSVAAFQAIASTQRVRLSSVRHSNDATEGTLLFAAVARIAARAGVVDSDITILQERAQLLETKFDGLALCMSEDGDLLSQWRGYADDGQGVAIGFSRAFLDELIALFETTDDQDDHFDIALYQARYSEGEHDAAIAPLFKLLQDYQMGQPLPDAPQTENVRELYRRIGALQSLRLSLEAYDHAYSLKHKAFAEEREWRLLRHFDWQRERPTGFHARRCRLVPYVDLEFSRVLSQAIGEVVLGPRHTTPTDVVEQFLQGTGHFGVSVTRSSSPYRRDA